MGRGRGGNQRHFQRLGCDSRRALAQRRLCALPHARARHLPVQVQSGRPLAHLPGGAAGIRRPQQHEQPGDGGGGGDVQVEKGVGRRGGVCGGERHELDGAAAHGARRPGGLCAVQVPPGGVVLLQVPGGRAVALLPRGAHADQRPEPAQQLRDGGGGRLRDALLQDGVGQAPAGAARHRGPGGPHQARGDPLRAHPVHRVDAGERARGARVHPAAHQQAERGGGGRDVRAGQRAGVCGVGGRGGRQQRRPPPRRRLRLPAPGRLQAAERVPDPVPEGAQPAGDGVHGPGRDADRGRRGLRRGHRRLHPLLGGHRRPRRRGAGLQHRPLHREGVLTVRGEGGAAGGAQGGDHGGGHQDLRAEHEVPPGDGGGLGRGP
mmetsp:Transcript_33586/g.73299  ORF Transcript_33586/g.73299 Transcript_33586/m.73299 type:complete len:377 (+) Transcript_33586:870-2000(+)